MIPIAPEPAASEAGEEEKIDTDRIAVLVEEVAEKAQTLKHAWDEYHSDHDGHAHNGNGDR